MVTATPNEHEKAEWSRMAGACYARGHNATGHAFGAAASLPRGAGLPLAHYDVLQSYYRHWLVFGGMTADFTR